jgi:hypothetical protein
LARIAAALDALPDEARVAVAEHTEALAKLPPDQRLSILALAHVEG